METTAACRSVGLRAPGPLNAAIKEVKADRMVELTIPDRPNGRLQQYSLPAAGRAAATKVRGG